MSSLFHTVLLSRGASEAPKRTSLRAQTLACCCDVEWCCGGLLGIGCLDRASQRISDLCRHSVLYGRSGFSGCAGGELRRSVMFVAQINPNNYFETRRGGTKPFDGN